MREMSPKERLSSHYADAFNKKMVKTLTNWTPAVSHIFVMDNSRLSQSVPSPPLARKKERGEIKLVNPRKESLFFSPHFRACSAQSVDQWR